MEMFRVSRTRRTNLSQRKSFLQPTTRQPKFLVLDPHRSWAYVCRFFAATPATAAAATSQDASFRTSPVRPRALLCRFHPPTSSLLLYATVRNAPCRPS